jgi:DNA-binding transcriptional regulator YdaS (Cro superfamily)
MVNLVLTLDMKKTPLEKAISHFGTATALAEELDVTKQAIFKWRRGRVPAERVLSIEEATGGAVTRYELRPDLYPKETAA